MGVGFGSPPFTVVFIVWVQSLNTAVACVSPCVALAILADRSVVRGPVFAGARNSSVDILGHGSEVN